MLNTKKLENIKVEMTRFDVGILDVSEIWWSESEDFWFDNYRVIYSGREKPGRAGVEVIINKKWDQQMINKIAYNARLVMVKLKAKPSDIVIIQVNLAKESDNLIIIGDWNAVPKK